jgi:nickel-dependent lactate racemase
MYELGTNAWYGDGRIAVHFPDNWEIFEHRPLRSRPLADDDLRQAFQHPCGQRPIREVARGRTRPVIVVDDCTRPTPAARVLPHVLDELQHAGIPANHIEIVVATGTHGPPSDSALHQKIGEAAWSRCRVHVHDDRRQLVHLGRDSRGSPVLVNRHVAAADYVIGIGGVYPQNSTGFGGGAKLILGVLGRRSIANLHFGNPSEEGSYNVDNDFRRELDEIADLVGLETSICLHVDAYREPVRITTGDHRAFYRDDVAFAAAACRADLPNDAEVVVANAYPMDLSLTFLRSKAITPLLRAAPGASRILIGGCPEGVGRHGLYPFLDHKPAARLKQAYWRLLVNPRKAPRAAAAKATQLVRSASSRTLSLGRPARNQTESPDGGPSAVARPIWLYTPNVKLRALQNRYFRVVGSWEEILGEIRQEQAGRSLRVALYPCSPLQVLGERQLASGSYE